MFRSCQIRSAKGEKGCNSISCSTRSRCAAKAADDATSPMRSSRRRMLLDSTRISSGPSTGPSDSARRAHLPSGPWSIRNATRAEESTTAVIAGQRHALLEWQKRGPGLLTLLPSYELCRSTAPKSLATTQHFAWTRFSPVRSVGSPLEAGQVSLLELPIHHGYLQERLRLLYQLA